MTCGGMGGYRGATRAAERRGGGTTWSEGWGVIISGGEGWGAMVSGGEGWALAGDGAMPLPRSKMSRSKTNRQRGTRISLIVGLNEGLCVKGG